MTLENMMVGAVMRGLSIDAFENMSPGQIVDYCIQYNNTINEEKEDKERMATQEDFDRF